MIAKLFIVLGISILYPVIAYITVNILNRLNDCSNEVNFIYGIFWPVGIPIAIVAYIVSCIAVFIEFDLVFWFQHLRRNKKC